MPMIVIVNINGMPAVRVLWSKEEWCQQVPRPWIEHCGCQRCCKLDIAKRFLPEKLMKRLERDGFTPWFKNPGTNHWWFLRMYNRIVKMVCLVPWPKHWMIKQLPVKP